MKRIVKLLFIILVIIVILGFIFFMIVKENKKESDVISDFSKDVFEKLVYDGSNSYFSLDDVVGSGNPEGYIFLANGNFSYVYGDYSPRDKEVVLSSRGVWKIENNKLILNVLEEKITEGGDLIDDPTEGTILYGYKEEVLSTNKIYEYEIDNVSYDDSHRIFITFKNSDIKLTKLTVGDREFIDNMIKIANQGY